MVMEKDSTIKLFEDKRVRIVWDEVSEEWFFSIVDIIEILTDSDRPRKYWSDLKSKLNMEGSQLSGEIGRLKMKAVDGKMRLTDIASTSQVLRLISQYHHLKQNLSKYGLLKLVVKG